LRFWVLGFWWSFKVWGQGFKIKVLVSGV